MTLALGTTVIETAYFGTSQVEFAYSGTTEVFANAFPASVTTVLSSYPSGSLASAYKDVSGNWYFNINMGSGSGGAAATVKTNSSFAITWSHYVTSSYGGPLQIHADSSENIYLGGFHGHSPGDYYMHFKRLTSTGSTSWGKEEGGGQTYASTLCGLQNGIVANAVHSGDGHSSWSVLNSDGSTRFTRALSNNVSPRMGIGNSTIVCWQNWVAYIYDINGNYQRSHSPSAASEATATADDSGNYFLIYQNGSNNPTFYISKFNSSGTKLWDRTFTFTTALYDWYAGKPDVDAAGNLYVAVSYAYSASGTRLSGLVKLDANGNVKYFRKYQCTSPSSTSFSFNHYNINRAKRSMIIGCSLAADGAIFELDLNNGGKAGTSASVAGYTFTIGNEPYSVSTSAITYGSGAGDPGGSRTYVNRDTWSATSPSYTATKTAFA